MKRLLFVALAAAIAAHPFDAAAQLFAPTPNTVEFLNFVGGSGVNGTMGVQVGPYVGDFRAGGPSGPASAQFSLYCVDYTHYATDQWVRSSALSGGSSLSSTRLGSGGYASYQQAAYLSSLFESWNTLGFAGTRATVWSGIHAAIWSVTSTPGPTVSGQTATIRNALLTGSFATAASNFNTAGWYVLSSNASNPYGMNGQEFLVRTVPVPEPSTMLLMVTGLFLLVGASRMRRGMEIEA
jgi:hypothetical protein